MMSTFLLFSLLLQEAVKAVSVKLIPDSGTPPSYRDYPSITFNDYQNKLYILGGYYVSPKDDMWEFDIAKKTWREIYPTSSVNPLARYASTLISLGEKILLYGGITKYGPVSDLWLFDIEQESWKIVEDTGTRPPRAGFSATTFYTYEGKRYLAVLGGLNKELEAISLYMYCIYRLDIETFNWYKPSISGNPPIRPFQGTITYSDGKLYYPVDEDTKLKFHVYDIETEYWSIIEIRTDYDLYGVASACTYSDIIYLVDYKDEVVRIKLDSDILEAEKLEEENNPIFRHDYGYTCDGSYLYRFGGAYDDKSGNELWRIEFSSDKVKWENLSKNLKTPTARSGHIMEVYNEKLYILGGTDKYGHKLIDIWAFDLKTEDWEPFYTISTISPAPRSDFSYTRAGEILIIFGGKTDTIISGDMYTLNFRTKEWKLIEPDSGQVPSPRTGSCMGSAGGYIFIFGGKTESNYTNELWMFDPGTSKYTLINAIGKKPHVTAYGNCRAYIDTSGDIIFDTYLGQTTSSDPLSSIFRYNHSKGEWTAIIESKDLSYRQGLASALLIGDKLLIAGGDQFTYIASNQVNILDITTQTYKTVTNLPSFSYNAGSVFYKNKLYIHGGGGNLSGLSLFDIPMNDLIVIEFDDRCKRDLSFCVGSCSEGTYYVDGKCVACPEGSYSDEIGATECKLCDRGHYSDIKGADSDNFCKPCLYGTFNTKPGQSRCLQCPYGKTCSLYEVTDIEEEYINQNSSEQPGLYKNNGDISSIFSYYFNLTLYIVSSIIILILLSFDKTRKFIPSFDIYQVKHNYEINKKMIKKKTLFGGLFTLIFFTIGISLICNTTLSLAIDNITENKALVPLVALEEKYENFIAQDILFEFKFEDYGGKCVKSEKLCVDEIEIYGKNFESDSVRIECRMQDLDCIVLTRYSGFELISSGVIGLELKEDGSYATGIRVKVSSSSSIPNEYSTIISSVQSDGYKYFRGPGPNIFYLGITPSLFLSDSGDWEKELTGYHISPDTDPQKGSQIEYSEISFSKNLKAEVWLSKSDSALLTHRSNKQTLSSFFSNLAGSILGTLGGLGFIMTQIEGKLESSKKKVVKRDSLDELTKRRFELINANINGKDDIETEGTIQKSEILSSEVSILDNTFKVNFIPFKMYDKLKDKFTNKLSSNSKIFPFKHI